MRICLISNGKSEHIQRLSSYLISLDHEVHLISGKVTDSYSMNIVLHRLSSNPLVWPLQIKHLVETIQPDIVDGHFASIYGFLAALSGFHPLTVTVWGSDIFVQPWHNPLWRFTVKYALNKADTINCLFPITVAEPALTRLNVNICKVRTSLLGVDTNKFKPLGFDAELAKELGIYRDRPLIINVRGFDPVYGFETYFQAIPLVLDKIPEAQFLALYRNGQREVGERLIDRLGIAGNVLLREWLPRSKMPQLLSLASINVSTSLSDGASNALLEAMACEVAPVVTDIAANHPWITDHENGLLFRPADSKKLAENIIFLLNSPETRHQFGIKCRQMVQEKAEQANEMSKIERLYRDLIVKISSTEAA